MTVQDALESSGIDRLDAEVLLAHLLEKDRTWLVTHHNETIHADAWNVLIQKRKQGMPVAYITKQKEFYGRVFAVNEHVLIPRPATEGLVDMAIRFLSDGKNAVTDLDTEVIGIARALGDYSDVSVIVDVGTGSGCIAITLALETGKRCIATDISKEALNVAKANAVTLGVAQMIDFKLGNLLEPVRELSVPFIVVSNPPYIPEDEKLMPDVQDFEPHTALFGGTDGDGIIRQLMHQAKAHPLCRGLLVECRKHHKSAFEELA